MATIYLSRVRDPNQHRNVTKQTNPLLVDNLIIDRSVEILEAFRSLDSVSKFLFLWLWKFFKQHVITASGGNWKWHIVLLNGIQCEIKVNILGEDKHHKNTEALSVGGY